MFLLFHGPDDFTAREELAALRAASEYEYNQETMTGAEVELGRLRAICDTLPFLSERRLVVLDGLPKPRRAVKDDRDERDDDEGGDERAPADAPAEEAGSAGGKGKSKGKQGKSAGLGPRAFVQALAEYVPALPETTTLVVLVGERLESTHPLVQSAQRHGRARLFETPRGAQLDDWLTRRARTAHARLTPEAARLLVGATGDDLRLLAGEIEKLATYVGTGGQIRAEEVHALTPVSREARVFDLTDALARRDRSRALALLHELLANGESPLGIVALTAYQTRTLLQVKTLAERGLRAPQIAQTAGMAPFVVEKSLPLARHFSFAQLEAAHRELLRVDTALKRSRMSPEMALDLLVLEFGATPS